jgi:hypothetical protein
MRDWTLRRTEVRIGVRVMAAAWTVKDGTGRLLADFVGASPLEVGRRIVPTHYDAFRLHVSSSYRALFDRAVSQVLEREGWKIVRMGRNARSIHAPIEAPCVHAA